MAYFGPWVPPFKPEQKFELSAEIERDARRTCWRCGVRNKGTWSMSPGDRLRILRIVEPDGKCYWYRQLCPRCTTLTMAQILRIEIEFVEEPEKTQAA